MFKQKLLEACLTSSDIKENSCGWTINSGNDYQNFLIFITLLITGDEGWMTNF